MLSLRWNTSALSVPEAVRPHSLGELAQAGRIDQRALFVLQETLYRRVPHAQILSESGYRFWSGLAANLTVLYRERHGAVGVIQLGTVADLAQQLSYLTLEEEGVFRTLRNILSDVFDPQSLTIRPSGISRIGNPGLGADHANVTPWHVQIARYVIEQDLFEGSPPPERDELRQKIDLLLCLYSWYVRLTTKRRPPVDRPAVYDILRQIVPEDWARSPAQLAMFGVRKLTQMLTIENAMGESQRKVTGYIEKPVPEGAAHNFVGANRVYEPERLQRLSAVKGILLHLFGRYYYLSSFSEAFPSERVDMVLRGGIHTQTIAEGEMPAVEALFRGLLTYLAEPTPKPGRPRAPAPKPVVRREAPPQSSGPRFGTSLADLLRDVKPSPGKPGKA